MPNGLTDADWQILLQRIEEGKKGSEPITIRLPASLKIRDSSRLPSRHRVVGI